MGPCFGMGLFSFADFDNAAPEWYLRPVADARVLTWSALLAVWSDFARSAGALPKTGDAGLLRRSVPGIIGLQSVTFALQHLDEIPAEEYCSGQDRAALTIRTLEAELRSIWKNESMPAALQELITEAGDTLARTRTMGYEYVPETDGFVQRAESDVLHAALDRGGFEGEFWVVRAGKRVRAGAPVAFIAGPCGRPLTRIFLESLGEHFPACLWGRIPVMRQVFEKPEAKGVRQTVHAVSSSVEGEPLLERIRPRDPGVIVVSARQPERVSTNSGSL